MAYSYTEDALIEQPAITLLCDIGWECFNAFNEFDYGPSQLGRVTKSEVVLLSRLRPALQKLNPLIPAHALEQAIEVLTEDRGIMTPVQANRQVYDLIKDGIKVEWEDPQTGEAKQDRVKVIDWNASENNDYLLVSQLWVMGEMYTRRTDLVGFVNGLPLVFIELKASHVNIENAYQDNLRDYKDTIPQLFWYNAFIILSNGSQSRIGSITAGWEHFADWKKINSEGEEGIISLDTMIRGTCDKARLLDLVENFILYKEVRGGTVKLVAKNHQYLGVNNAIARLMKIKGMTDNVPDLVPEVPTDNGELRKATVAENEADYRKGKGTLKPGQLGVYWHTQGSGKSVSMIFFAQKVLRKLPGNWSFVVVTDRDELDTQIYKEFASTGVITEDEKTVQAGSTMHLRQLLAEDHRYLFTLIHKFRNVNHEPHPICSERSDIIVITDEAHRSQYDTLAMNMRTALPNAQFIAFTGTPLIAGEERTKDVFGEYVSIYNFQQSIEDGATVPLYYENRIPELQLNNENLNDDIYRVIEEADLDEDQEERLEKTLGKQYHLITRDDRLDSVAKDIVVHFMGRGYRGKAMVICIDKATTLRMYDKVKRYWGEYLTELRHKVALAPEADKSKLQAAVDYMAATDMAVVVSGEQNEIAKMKDKGLDIKPHRKRMVDEELESQFKDPDDPFRIVFVCAMWITGFDVPHCSTIYLDKPLRNHTLMQTIARANRVARNKENGLIVDYVGVFRSLQKALAIYGKSVHDGEMPIKDKKTLLEMLQTVIEEAYQFCASCHVSIDDIVNAADQFKRVKLLDDAFEAIVVNEASKKEYLRLAGNVTKIFKAILPDSEVTLFAPKCIAIDVIAKKIRSATTPADISQVLGAIEQVLDSSISAEGYRIEADPNEVTARQNYLDLSKIDFDFLAEKFKQGQKRAVVERLKAAIERTLDEMIRMNRTRIDYMEKFEKLIAEYNSGSRNIEEIYDELRRLVKALTDEEQRHIKENLSEEELAIYDLLTKPAMNLKDSEIKQVKKVAHELLEKLKREKLSLDWRKRQDTRAAVLVTIQEILDRLPDNFTKEIYDAKCNVIFQHVYETYFAA